MYDRASLMRKTRMSQSSAGLATGACRPHRQCRRLPVSSDRSPGTCTKRALAASLCKAGPLGRARWRSWPVPRDRLLSSVYGSLGRMTGVGEVVLNGSETSVRPDR
jgi:hypothetical protein